jgi:hypothetical protein
LTIATIDPSFEGTYEYSIKVTESVSGFSNDDVDFELVFTVKIYATEMNLANTIADKNYLIGDAKLSFEIPELFTFVPSNSVFDVVYSLVGPPSFVSLRAGTWIDVETSDLANTGTYEVEVLTTDNESGLSDSYKFNLILACVRTISITAALEDVEYYITDDAILRNPTVTISPADCQNELTYDVTLANSAPLPSSIVFEDP